MRKSLKEPTICREAYAVAEDDASAPIHITFEPL